MHDKDTDGCSGDCHACSDVAKHKSLYHRARAIYASDGENVVEGRIVRSVDLQKVIMLPRLPGVKSVCFTKRIIAFHLTFSPIVEYSKNARTTSLVWHEGLAGRKCEEISSMYVKALIVDRDYKEIIYFMDNCSSQNKNWSIITAMTKLINSELIAADKVTFKYLEAGHTFMSADTVHASVERQMKLAKNVYDFDDFVGCVAKAKSNVIAPSNVDFRNYKGEQSQSKLAKEGRPHLASCRQLEFRKGHRSLFYKQQHDDSDFKEFDFMRAKCKLDVIPDTIRESPRGIPDSKKADIVTKLCPLMPASRRVFWEKLSTAMSAI